MGSGGGGVLQPLDFQALPAAPAGSVNVTFQADVPTPPPTAVIRKISGYVTFAYDLTIYFGNTQTVASQEIFRMNVRRTLNFPGNFSGTVGGISCISGGSAKTPASSSSTWNVNKNGASIGTIVWAGAGTTPTFTTTGGAVQTFVLGDILTITGPVTPDTSLANWGVTLVSTRT
jgi:hypothetical protein